MCETQSVLIYRITLIVTSHTHTHTKTVNVIANAQTLLSVLSFLVFCSFQQEKNLFFIY